MAYKIIMTRTAARDIDAIIHYLTENLSSPITASEHLQAIKLALESISITPEMYGISQQPSSAARKLRPCLIKNYVLLYRFDGEHVIVMRLFHQRQDYARLILTENSN